jgi:hypothetical protein
MKAFEDDGNGRRLKDCDWMITADWDFERMYIL